VKTLGLGFADRMMTDAETREIVMQGVEQLDAAGKRVLVIIPDHTRTAPIAEMFRLLYEGLGRRVAALDYLVALGTHPAMSEEMICGRVGLSAEQYRCSFPQVRFFNHLWRDPGTLTQIGTLTTKEVGDITDGLFELEVPITINKIVFDYDLLLIVGPVFPHEVVGFSGGNKYLFPGIAGQQIIDFFHWLGAVITNPVEHRRRHGPAPLTSPVSFTSPTATIPITLCCPAHHGCTMTSGPPASACTSSSRWSRMEAA
jgi:nickel-dependent lactate racemase